MYIVAGARTPFSFYQTRLHLLKTHNLGATAVRALLSMLPGIDGTSVQKLFVSTTRQVDGSVHNIAQRSGLDVHATPIVHGKGAGIRALIAMKKAPPSGAGVIVGVEGGHGQTMDTLGETYVVERTPYLKNFMDKEAEELNRYCGYDVHPRMWAAWLRHSCDRAHEALKADVLLHEIAPIALSVNQKVTHIMEDDRVKDKRRKHAKQEGVMQLKHAAPLCDGAAALCVSAHKGKDTLARIVATEYMPPSEDGALKSLELCARALLRKCAVKNKDVHIVEVDESIIFTPYVCAKSLGVARENVNRWGGMCAIGNAGPASELRMVLSAAYGMILLEQRWALVLCHCDDGAASGIMLERTHERH